MARNRTPIRSSRRTTHAGSHHGKAVARLRSQAARKGWQTRRANARARSERSRKRGWDTRRKTNAAQLRRTFKLKRERDIRKKTRATRERAAESFEFGANVMPPPSAPRIVDSLDEFLDALAEAEDNEEDFIEEDEEAAPEYEPTGR